MKNKILFILALALGIAPNIQTMEYSGPPDEPGDKSGKEEIVEVEAVAQEQAPANMLTMISDDGHEFFVDTQVAQESPVLVSAINFSQRQGEPLIYKSNLSKNELEALIRLLTLQRTTPRFKPEALNKIDAIFKPLTEQEQSHLLGEALNYFELPIAAFYTAFQLVDPSRKAFFDTKKIAKDVTPHENLQGLIRKYFRLIQPEFIRYLSNPSDFSFSIQDLIDFNKLPRITRISGQLDLSTKNINDLTGWENIPHKEAITELNLSYNKISNLPTGIFDELNNLKTLNLSSNQLTNVPKELGKLKNLEYLMLNRNKISEISPKIFKNLKKLKHISLLINEIPFSKWFKIPGVNIEW